MTNLKSWARLVGFLFCFCLIVTEFYAIAEPLTTSLKGLAVVRIKSRRVKDQSFQQAVVIKGGDARFIGLDDFGGVAFEINFKGDQMSLDLPGASVKSSVKKIKRLLSLPIKKSDFLAVLTHVKPESWKSRLENDAEYWMDPRHEKLKVTFTEFLLGPLEPHYPKRIVISYKDHLFDLKWLNVEF